MGGPYLGGRVNEYSGGDSFREMGLYPRYHASHASLCALQIKNMEYKNIDEKTPPTGADAERAGEGEGDAGDDEATVVDYGVVGGSPI